MRGSTMQCCSVRPTSPVKANPNVTVSLLTRPCSVTDQYQTYKINYVAEINNCATFLVVKYNTNVHF